MAEQLNGASRIHFIVGDPIAQVKSPAGVTQAFADAGHNAICVPAHVAPPQLAAWMAGVSLAQNVDGIIVTVPHKFACHDLSTTRSERAAFLHTVNTMRRNPDGSWHGDMFDGLGFVTAMRDNGGEPQGGAGGGGGRGVGGGGGGAGGRAGGGGGGGGGGLGHCPCAGDGRGECPGHP